MDEFSGKDSLLGKITHYFDIGSSTKTPKNGWFFSNTEKKEILSEHFNNTELKQIYNKINECEKITTTERINPFFTNDKIAKVYDYLNIWKSKYWEYQNMENFLCGLLGKIKTRTKQTQLNAINSIAVKTNNDISNKVKEYVGIGGRRYKTGKKYRKTRKTKKTYKK